MSIIISPESQEAIDRARWEQFPNRFGGVGNPYQYREYPKMLYKAMVRADGKAVCMDPPPEATGGGPQAEADYQFRLKQWDKRTRESVKSVGNQDEERAALNAGWRPTPAEALARHEGLEQDIAQAAAEANYAAEKMSPKAQRERKAREAATDQHVPE